MLLKIAGLAAATLALGLSAAPARAQVSAEDLAGAWEIVLGKHNESMYWYGIFFRDDQTGCLSYDSAGADPQFKVMIYNLNDDRIVVQIPDQGSQESFLHVAGDDILVLVSLSSIDSGDFAIQVLKRSTRFETCEQLRSFDAEDIDG